MNYISREIKVIKQRDPSIKNSIEVFLYPSFYAVLFHRLSHRLYRMKWFFVARMISQLSRWLTGIEIHPGAKIGQGLFIDHGMGVVIGETCEIGNDVTLFHGVTLGGTGKETGKRHPTIGNNVLISTGAKILGPFKVGDNSRIAAGAVVLKEVPADATVVGIPGRVVRHQGKRIDPCNTLDQIQLPDPVQMEICKLSNMVEDLTEKVSHLEEKLKVETKTFSEDLIVCNCEEENCTMRDNCAFYEAYKND